MDSLTWVQTHRGCFSSAICADPAWHFQENTNNGTQYTGDTVTEGVPTIFHHALAQVVFKAYALKTSVDGLCTWTITLKNVKITNIYNQGSLSLSATEPAESVKNSVGTWGTPAWTTSGTKDDLTPANLGVTATVATSANVLLANQSVLPQALTDVHLTFDLDIVTNYTAGQTNHEIIPIDIPLAGTSGFNTASWVLNHKYTYIVKIEPSENKVLFDPAVEEEWVEETEAEKTI